MIKALGERMGQFPAVVVQPANPNDALEILNGQWDPAALDAWLDGYLAQRSIDPDQVHLVGFSRGGIGTWEWATASPKRFASVTTVAGIGNPLFAPRLARTPCWLFCGERDDDFFYLGRAFADALRATGTEVHWTPLPATGHSEAVPKALTPELFAWMLSKRRTP